MTAIKTNYDLHPVQFVALVTRAKDAWVKNEFDGKVKTDSQGRELYRGDGLTVMRIDENGSPVGQFFGQISINVATPINLVPGQFYRPVGNFTWNDYDSRKTSITLEALEVVPAAKGA